MSELIEMPYGTGKTVGIWRTICLPSYPPQYRYECSKCSVCSKEMSNYCPYCGAEMQFLEREFIKKYSEIQLDVEIDEESEDMEQLKSCPFCNGEANTCVEVYANRVEIEVGCKVCGFWFTDFAIEGSSFNMLKESEGKLIARWNRRADNGKEDI